MKKNGFTLIELITTFALASVLIILLINIALVIKDVYTKSSTKAELITEQSNINYLINKKFGTDNLKTYTPCDESVFCYDFIFNDGTTDRLVVNDGVIRFGSYVYKTKKGTEIGECKIEIQTVKVSSVDVYDSFLIINVPIEHSLFKNEDFGINIIYQYNAN